MATISTMAMLNTRCMRNKSPRPAARAPPILKPISLFSLQNLPKGLALPRTLKLPNPSSQLTASAVAGAVFSVLATSDAAFAAQQIADIAESSDNRGLALLLPIIPAVLWVLFNILQPALNQLNRMRSERGVIVGLGLGGGLTTAGLLSAPSASAIQQIANVAEASDNRGLALLIPIIPAILWVLYNILQPALNQLNRMRSG